MTLPCPACSIPLGEIATPDGPLFACARCGGIWIDNAASTRVAEASLSRDALARAMEAGQDAHDDASTDYHSAPPTDIAEGHRRCPVCAQTLSTVDVAAAATRIEICHRHGTFFDRDELVRVHAGFANEKLSALERRRALGDIVHKFRPGR